MSSEGYHEPLDLISEDTRNLHRGIVSLIEELEAIDWYQQRAEACSDTGSRGAPAPPNEEIEHAIVSLEWLRRRSTEFDEKMRIYLFTQGRIVEVEARAEAAERAGGAAPSAPAPRSGGARRRGAARRDGARSGRVDRCGSAA